MKSAFGLNIPQTLEEVCEAKRAALLVYDMQIGILGQIKYPERIIRQVLRVLTAARETGVRVFFSRHLLRESLTRRSSAWLFCCPPFLRDSPP